MATNAAEIRIQVSTNAGKANTQLKGLDRTLDKNDKSAGKLAKSMGKAGLAAGIALAVAGAVKLTKALVEAGRNAEETENKFSVTFSSIRAEADLAAENLQDNFGLSSQASQQLLSDTGDLLTGFGFTQESALGLSEQVNELAVDLASFTNFSGGAEGASAALTKALLGERESIKSLGIAITEADIKRLAEDKGITGELDRQTKAMLTLELATTQSKNAIGDYERSAGTLTQVQKEATAEVQDLAKNLGETLQPAAAGLTGAFGKLVGGLNDYIEKTREARQEGLRAAGIDEEDTEAIKDYENAASQLSFALGSMGLKAEELPLRMAQISGETNLTREQVILLAKDLGAATEAQEEFLDAQLEQIEASKSYQSNLDLENHLVQQATHADEERVRAAQGLADARADIQERMSEALFEYASEQEKQVAKYNEEINSLAALRAEARDLGTDYSALQRQINELVAARNELIESMGEEVDHAGLIADIYAGAADSFAYNTEAVKDSLDGLGEKNEDTAEKFELTWQDAVGVAVNAFNDMGEGASEAMEIALSELEGYDKAFVNVWTSAVELLGSMGGPLGEAAADLMVGILDNAFAAEGFEQYIADIVSDIDAEIAQVEFESRKDALDMMYDAEITRINALEQARLEAFKDTLSEKEIAALKSAGVIKETELERIEREKQEAIDAGDTEALHRLENEAQIEKILKDSREAREKAEAEYRNKVAQWEYEKAIFERDLRVSEAEASKNAALADLPWWASKDKRGEVASTYDELISTISGVTIPSPPSFQFGGSYEVPPGNARDSGMIRVNQGERVDISPVRGSGGGDRQPINIMVDRKVLAKTVVDLTNSGEGGRIQSRIIR